MRFVEDRKFNKIMKEWPKAFVGKAVVEVIDFLFVQRYWRIVVLHQVFFKQKTAYEIGSGLVGSEMCIRDRQVSAMYDCVMR